MRHVFLRKIALVFFVIVYTYILLVSDSRAVDFKNPSERTERQGTNTQARFPDSSFQELFNGVRAMPYHEYEVYNLLIIGGTSEDLDQVRIKDIINKELDLHEAKYGKGKVRVVTGVHTEDGIGVLHRICAERRIPVKVVTNEYLLKRFPNLSPTLVEARRNVEMKVDPATLPQKSNTLTLIHERTPDSGIGGLFIDRRANNQLQISDTTRNLLASGHGVLKIGGRHVTHQEFQAAIATGIQIKAYDGVYLKKGSQAPIASEYIRIDESPHSDDAMDEIRDHNRQSNHIGTSDCRKLLGDLSHLLN